MSKHEHFLSSSPCAQSESACLVDGNNSQLRNRNEIMLDELNLMRVFYNFIRFYLPFTWTLFYEPLSLGSILVMFLGATQNFIGYV